MTAFKKYYELTKPGIVYGNAVNVLAGILIASAIPRINVSYTAILSVVIGTSILIASACIVNNILDLEFDKKMKRTKKRPLVTGEVSITQARILALIFGLIGSAVLLYGTNWCVWVCGLVAFVFYTSIYTPSKRFTEHSTLIGSIPGALPIVAGYVALVGRFDIVSVLLFGILVAWQMPHFYAISLYRRKEYEAARLPVLSVLHSERYVISTIVLYQILYTIFIVLFGLVGGLQTIWAVLMSVLAIVWAGIGLRGFDTNDTARWAHGIFGFSLILTLALPIVALLNLCFRV